MEGKMKKLKAIAHALGSAVITFISAFNAQAETQAHPILDPFTGATRYSGTLLGAVIDSGVPLGGGLARAAVGDLESALKGGLPDQSSLLIVPNPQKYAIKAGDPVMQFALAPQGTFTEIPFCLGVAGDTVKLKGFITTSGDVVKDFSTVSTQPTANPCAGWMAEQIAKLNVKTKISGKTQ
jgi:hypothetical protein